VALTIAFKWTIQSTFQRWAFKPGICKNQDNQGVS
jgi:hypothetical protein